MSDLIQTLKDRLQLAELVRDHGVALKPGGPGKFKGITPFRSDGERTPSFYVFADTNSFKCFSTGHGGDVLTWLTWARFGRFQASGEDFMEVLKFGCEKAGLQFEQFQRGDAAKAHAAGLKRRQVETILGQYVEVAQKAFTVAMRNRAREIKSYLSDDIIDRWSLGYAPTGPQLDQAGLPPEILAKVGLFRDGQHGEHLFYRDSIIIPFFERGRVVYLADRTIGERARKAMCLPSPNKDGTGGVSRPACFNIDALYQRPEVLTLVEAPLGAIYLCEMGIPAVACVTSSPSAELVKRLRSVA